MTRETIDVVGLCGSLRSASINRMALTLAEECMPPGMALDVVDWRAIPPFDADLMARGVPAEVYALRERLRTADALLISTPEYNFSIPGMLKNALDWISRGDDQPLRRKPVAILSAAPGPVGGARVQYELRKVLLFMEAMVLAKPEVFIAHAASKFDAEGRCVDEATRSFVRSQMSALEAWTADIRAMSSQHGPAKSRIN